ncbi:AAA family ATPase, partial [uncultured Microbacterium sp.]|uniref:AAA family ATPase n=1 Tax=uncultured Microbacterium sp. TaxID=191216 RepID=UPI002632BA7A
MSFPELSTEQQELYRLIEDTREHVFITGRAGTGKSTLLQYFAWNTQKQIAICAPTGVAALNVEGQTIHSLFRLPIGLIAESEIEQNDATRRILNAIDTLVIDEVSMVNADLMDGMDRALRQARGRRAEPFGGVQIIMFGDPYQLAPVPPRGDEARYVKDHYRSFWFFDAKVWAGATMGDAGA